MNAMPDLYPAIVRSYDAVRRMVRVEIPGITDGGDVLPEAELLSSIGDKSEHTEVRILAGDRVWVSFAMGDPRYPVIMGYRPKQTGNNLDWRRWHHKNIELDADDDVHVKAKRLIVDASVEVIVNTPKATVNATDTATVNTATATINASTEIHLNTPTVYVSDDLVVGGNVQVGGNATITGVTIGDGINLKTHTHPGVTSGGASTGPAQ